MIELMNEVFEMVRQDKRLEAKPERGSTFYISVPCIKNVKVKQKEKHEDISVQSMNLTGRTVNIAEDHLESYLFLLAILNPFEPTVKQAQNGLNLMNYPGAELTKYQMESFVSDPEGRGIKPLPSRPPKRT